MVSIFVELIGKTNTGSRCSQLVSQGVTQVFFQLLAREAKTDVTDDIIIQIHYVLSKLALKGHYYHYVVCFRFVAPMFNFECQNGRNQLLVEYYCSVGYF